MQVFIKMVNKEAKEAMCTVDMDSVPLVGEHIDIDGVQFAVERRQWTVVAMRTHGNNSHTAFCHVYVVPR